MSAVLILAPVVISSWPAITAAVAGAAVAMGLNVHHTAKELAKAGEQVQAEQEEVEVAVAESSEVEQNLNTDQEIVLTKGTIEVRVRRDARGRVSVCAKGRGHTKAELKAVAEEFSQRMTQAFVYNRVMTELKARGFQTVNEERMQDETLRIHVRRWEG